MAVKVKQCPDDPSLPTTVRDDIINSSRSDSNKRGLFKAVDKHLSRFGVDSVVFLFAVTIVLFVVAIGVTGWFQLTERGHPAVSPVLNQTEANVTRLGDGGIDTSLGSDDLWD